MEFSGKKIVVISAAGLAALSASAQERPNIIYILADDLGYGELGCYGQRAIETPNIDAIARTGMRFTNHYAGSPVSGPSRSTLLTGQHTGHTYIRGNDEMGSRGDVWSHEAMLRDSILEGQRPLPAGTFTFARMLQNAGYTTACVGKWGLGYPGSEGTPNKMGFDFFYGYNCQRQGHTYYPPFLYRNEHREYLKNVLRPPHTHLPDGADPLDEKSYAPYSQEEYSPDLMFREIKSFVRDQTSGKPFLLLWTTTVPHVSLQAPKDWVDYYVKKFGDEEPYLGQTGYFPTRYPHATYAAMVSHFDEQIGELIALLKEKGLYDNTVIIFTSDNGPDSSGGTDGQFFRSGGIYRVDKGYAKASVYEGGLRVPFIASWKGHIQPMSVSDHICAFWDMMPTFAELAGVQLAPGQSDGISMVPELLGKKQEKHKYLYWEFPQVGGKIAVRKGPWKGIINDTESGNRKMMLFNLNADPTELHDVADEHPDVVSELESIITQEHHPSPLKAFQSKYFGEK